MSNYQNVSLKLTSTGYTPKISVSYPWFPLDATTINLGVALINSTYAATATGIIQGLLDTEDDVWVDIASFNLSIAAGSEPAGDVQAISTPWLDYRINLSTITGVGSYVKLIAIVKR